MKTRVQVIQIAATGIALLCGSALAQNPKAAAATQPATPPVPAAPAVPPAPAKIEPPAPSSTDSDVLSVIGLLKGNFLAAPVGDQPGLQFNGAFVNIAGLDNAVYFEVARADSPQAPFRQGILTAYKQSVGGKPELRLRVLEFGRLASTFPQSLTGLWLAPDAFPTVTLDQLTFNTEIPLAAKDGGFAGTSNMVPTVFAHATQLSSEVALTKGSIRWADRGFDAAGKQVFGPPPGTSSDFRAFTPTATIERRDGGLIVIDLVKGKDSAPKAADGSELYMQYTGWVAADGFQFDSSRQPNREPLKVVLPGQLIQGWNMGLPGVQLGTIRRLVIPGALGYGERGNPRARIPGNATLVFDVECVYHKVPEKSAGTDKPEGKAPSMPAEPLPAPAKTTNPPTTQPKPGAEPPK